MKTKYHLIFFIALFFSLCYLPVKASNQIEGHIRFYDSSSTLDSSTPGSSSSQDSSDSSSSSSSDSGASSTSDSETLESSTNSSTTGTIASGKKPQLLAQLNEVTNYLFVVLGIIIITLSIYCYTQISKKH